MAIIEYLDETRKSKNLLPKDPCTSPRHIATCFTELLNLSTDSRALVRGFADIIASDIQPLQKVRAVDMQKGDKEAWGRYWIEKGFRGMTKSGIM